MVTTVVLASTLYGTATVTAAFDAGLAPRTDGRRVLVVSNNSPVAEVVPSVHELPEFGALAAEFDDVVSFNDSIAPFHPSTWEQGNVNSRLWEQVFRREWGLGADPVHLVVESVQVRPARTLMEVFADASISVYADGLMSYGPTRSSIDPTIGDRIGDLWYPELVRGLRPVLLREHGVDHRPVPLDALRPRLESLVADGASPSAGSRSALLVGQYLSSLELISHDEEVDLYRSMIDRSVEVGADSIVFKPHPGDVAVLERSLAASAAAAGVPFTVVDSRAPVEALVSGLRPSLIVGCFSTALIGCWALHGVRPLAVGTELMLERLTPYWNSNRMPLVLVDSLVALGRSFDAPPEASDELIQTVETVAYLMQPERVADLADVAQETLAAGAIPPRYLDRERITELGLPGADPVRRVVRRAARLKWIRRPTKSAYRAMGKTGPTRALRARLGS